MSDIILRKALQRLNQPEKFDKYWAYLSGEWLSSREDLSIASKDEQVWSELKLPVRLKIEVKNILEEGDDEIDSDSGGQPTASTTAASASSKVTTVTTSNPPTEEEITKAWVLYYSDEHQAYYYYNNITGESQWAASEEYDESYNNNQEQETTGRVFSKPKVQSGHSKTFVKGKSSIDEEDEEEEDYKRNYDSDDHRNKKNFNKKGGSSSNAHSKQQNHKSKSSGSSRRKSNDSYSDRSDSDDHEEENFYSSSSSARSNDSDSSQYYIISEETSSKRKGKLKVETYSVPKDKDHRSSSNNKGNNAVNTTPKKDVGFTNKFKEHLHLDEDDDYDYDDMAVPVRSTRDQMMMPSAPTEYEQTLRQYRQNTKLMSGNDINSQTPVLAKKNGGVNRRDAYMADNLRNVDEKLTPKNSPAFAPSYPTPVLDHGELYDAPNTDEVVDGMNDLLLRELALGYNNGLLPRAPASPPPAVASAKQSTAAEPRQNNVIHRYPVRPKADSRIEDMEQVNKQRGIKDVISDAVGVGKKAPIPGNMPNHIDALHGQPLSPVETMRSERQKKEDKEINDVQRLVNLGFNERAVKFALQMSDWNFEEAHAMLVESQTESEIPNNQYYDHGNEVDPSSEPITMDTVDAVLVEDHHEDYVPTATDPIAIVDAAEEDQEVIPKKKKSGIKKLFKMFK